MTHILFRPLSVLLPCLACAFATTPAHAGGTADAAISSVRLGVLDLTPTDGLVAGFDVLSAKPSLYASLNAAPAEYYAAGLPGPRMPATVAVAFGASGGTASTSGALADVAAHATGAGNLGDYGYAAASGNEEVRLTLHPYSVVTVAGHLSSRATRGDDIEHYDVVGMTSVSIVDANGYTYTQHTRQSLSYADWPARMAIEEDFTLAFANGSAEDQAVTLYFQTWSNVTRMAAPVPEPSMAALLAGGALWLVGLRLRGRMRTSKRQRRPIARAA
ncbi:hypothetical protein [Pseudoduganella armeniaca]|uniref:PEP-CTERM sorting domain-containing protein n=1 Tax=Pseudoduganella armeniaca TaxID=2072590 RepID=A0A2R4CEG9_9BURK|nr:hypothetical protein [Pseudoduganella armeniaca]AVR97880.1 hypothetical protein C9I28_21245 [Pseudoduganella armeniaca]